MDSIETWERIRYPKVLAANIRSARAGAGISQVVLAERMRALGFDQWLHQTVGASERAERRVTAEEILGLALALSCSISELMEGPRGDKLVMLTDDLFIGSVSVRRLAFGNTDGTLTWAGGEIGAQHVLATPEGRM